MRAGGRATVTIASVMRLLLVRHAESEWNAAGRLQGQADPPLSELGRHQAARVAARLADEEITAIVSSDLARAAATARMLGEVVGLPIEERRGLREVDLGSWTGVDKAELRRASGHAWARWRRDGVEGWEGGERYGEAMRRIAGEIAVLFERFAAETVVAVTHGGSIRLATCRLLGMRAGHLGRIASIGNTSITEFHVQADGSGRLERLNDIAHLLAPTSDDDLEAATQIAVKSGG